VSEPEIREAVTEADWEAVRAVRQEVFVEEQSCPPEEEWDAHDAPEARGVAVHHLLAERDGRPVGCARWRLVRSPGGEATVKLERFAVVPEARGSGLGRALVARALADARAAGHRRFVLHAQTYVADLYASFGFRPEGEVFHEAGIEHVKMTLEDR
jgi:predicted GNAT family N-acyltransferase